MLARGPQLPSPLVPVPPEIAGQTVRMLVRSSIGGPRIRLTFTNAMDTGPVTFDAVHAALGTGGSKIIDGSDRVVTFGGRPSLQLFPGATAISDPVNLPVGALTDVAVSLHLSGAAATKTVHPLGLNPTYIAPGNQTATSDLDRPMLIRSYLWLKGLSIERTARHHGTIVALGDSITDGFRTTPGAHGDWPDLLAARLQSDPRAVGWGVINAGISGNRILRAAAGDPAVLRFDADVLARPGVRWIILLEGINDINKTIIPAYSDRESVTADQIIQGMDQLIERAHAHGIRIAGGTMTATKGLPFYNARGEAMRQAVNHWIRTSGRFDAVIDFDAATRDPQDPLRLAPAYDSGDHVHPNDEGNRAMADAINLGLFR